MAVEEFELNPGGSVPLFISAGIMKEPAQFEPFLGIEDPMAVPLLTAGSFTWDEWAGNAPNGEQDFVYYPDRNMAGNCIGLRNPGRVGIAALAPIADELEDMGIKVSVSITNLPQETAVDVIPPLAEFVVEQGFTRVEVNLSCPNGKRPDGTLHPPLSSDADASAEVMAAVEAAIGMEPVILAKDSPHVTSLEDGVNEEEIAALAMGIGDYVDAIVGINTIGNQVFEELRAGNGRGGMSGPVVAPIARRHAELWGKHAPLLPYLSTGGIDSANAEVEAAARLAMPNVIRIGGAQEFYRARRLLDVAGRWAVATA